MTNLNLQHHRGRRSVWDRGRRRAGWRLTAAVAGGAGLAIGLLRRTRAGFWLAMAGGALAGWALRDRSGRRPAAGRDRLPTTPADERVDEASRESFPASDPPAIGPPARED